MAAPVDQASGNGEQPATQRAGDGEPIVGMDVAEADGPTNEIVGEHSTGQPGRIGEELARWAVLESGSFFEVANGEFDPGMVTVELVDRDGVGVEIGDEGMVSPVRP
jgi:hypothetical protein